jgi:hypothetical protein
MRTVQQDRRAPANQDGELDQERENRDSEGGAGNGKRNVEQGLERGDHDGFPLVLEKRRVRCVNEQDCDDAE